MWEPVSSGGILSGFATAKLTNMEEIPFGIIFSIGFALVGMLIQFAINRLKYEDEDEGEAENSRRTFQKRRPAVYEEEPTPISRKRTKHQGKFASQEESAGTPTRNMTRRMIWTME